MTTRGGESGETGREGKSEGSVVCYAAIIESNDPKGFKQETLRVVCICPGSELPD